MRALSNEVHEDMMASGQLRFARRAAWAAIGALLLFGCATNPVTGKRELSLVSGQQETQIGKEGYQAVLQEYGAYGNTRLQSYVDSVGQALARVSHRPDIDWHFTLLDDPTVNAFAMPGGYIYITRGILAHLNSEAQLAGVLGHEIGHVTARHTAQQITQQQIAGLGLGLASIFVRGFGQYSDAAQTALGLMFLKYSRDHETQADELGVEYSTKAGWDSREMSSTYAMLRRVGERSGSRLPNFLSTHPDPGDRENRTRALAQAAVAGKTGLIVRQRAYVSSLDGITYGTDPRQGYFEGNHFYHPEMRFEITMPSGWKTANSRQAVLAGEPNNQAQMQLTLADAGALSPSAYVADLQSKGKVLDTRGSSESIGGFSAWIGTLLIQGSDGSRRQLFAAFIRRSSDQMFQILGVTAAPGDDNESRIAASARSLRGLSDPARLNVSPNRVDVVEVTQPGAFQQVAARQGNLAIDLDEVAILNNVELDEEIRRGELIKLVVKGR
jgi:predicted Zn-dependent protease